MVNNINNNQTSVLSNLALAFFFFPSSQEEMVAFSFSYLKSAPFSCCFLSQGKHGAFTRYKPVRKGNSYRSLIFSISIASHTSALVPPLKADPDVGFCWGWEDGVEGLLSGLDNEVSALMVLELAGNAGMVGFLIDWEGLGGGGGGIGILELLLSDLSKSWSLKVGRLCKFGDVAPVSGLPWFFVVKTSPVKNSKDPFW